MRHDNCVKTPDKLRTAFRSAVVAAAMVMASVMSAARADAAPILYDFTVTFTSGDLAGQSFDGSLSVDGDDCPGGVCDGSFWPSNLSNTLQSFDITINTDVFDETQALLYPDFPFVTFNEGALVGMIFQALPGSSILNITFGVNVNEVVFSGSDGRGFGTINVEQPSVPEPLSMTLIGLGVAGVAIRARRRRTI